MASKSSITVKILGDAKGVDSVLDHTARRLGRFAGTATKFGVAAGSGVLAIGAGLAQIGATLDGAVDNIAIKTGATGGRLDALESSFAAVAGRVPAGMEDVSSAVAGLSQRLDLTGKPLEDMSAQMLELSRMTGTDLSTNIDAATRVLGDWGVSAEDSSASIDKLFVASQQTGVGVDELARGMTQFGGPMRQLGFSFEDTAALLGKFEAEGVNTNLVMGSMRQALGRMAKAGEDPVETLGRVSDQIKNAGSAGEANAIALELFGAKAGPDMAAAIREGRFEVDDLVKAMDGTEGAVMKTSAATQDWQEKLKVLGNKAMLKLGPIANATFDGIGRAVELATPYLERLGVWLGEKIPPIMVSLRGWFEENWPRLQAAVAAVVVWLQTVAWPIVQRVFSAIRSGIAAVRTWWDQNWSQIKGTVLAGVELIRAAIDRYLAIIRGIWERWGGAIVGFLRATWANVQTVVQGALNIVRGIFTTVTALLKGDWGKVWDGIKQILSGAWQVMKGVVRQAMNAVGLILRVALDVLSSLWSKAWDGIKALPGAALRGAASLISGAAGAVIGAAASIWSGVLDGAEQLVTDVGSAIGKIPGKILEWVGDFLSAGTDLGAAIVDGLVAGVKGVAGVVGDISSALMDGIRGAWNTFADTVNGWLPDSVGAGPFKIDFPDNPIPKFHSGGWVPGMPGREVPAVLEAGEFVLSRQMIADGALGGSGISIGQIVVGDARGLRAELESIEWRRRARPAAWSPVGA